MVTYLYSDFGDYSMIGKRYKGYGAYILTGMGFKAPIDAIFNDMNDEEFVLENIDFFKELGISRWDKFWKKTWDSVLKNPEILKINYFVQKRFMMPLYTELHYMTCKKQLLEWIETEQPDFILTSHFITTLLLPFAVKKLGKRIPVFAYNAEVISAHSSNVAPLVDRYFSPTEIGTGKLVKCGQPEATIKATPFPIDKKFKRDLLSCKESREKLGLKNIFTILLTFGGDGIGSVSMMEMVIEKKLPVQILAVCGRNEELKAKLEKIKNDNPEYAIQIYGFVSNMEELMNCSDICAGKSGMNATFESLYMKKPYMATAALANEIATLDFIVENGFGWDATDLEDQIRIIESCIDDPGYYNTIVKNIVKSDIDFHTEKFNLIIKKELYAYKKNMLQDSKALYFDMAGTLCDIPISGIWEKVNKDGIIKVVKNLGWDELLSEKDYDALCDHFVNEKKKLRKDSKLTLKEADIRIQLGDFIKYALKNYDALTNTVITKTKMDCLEKLFVSTELDITEPFSGVVSVLENLSKKYDLYLLSNNVSRQLVLDIVEKIGCSHCFKDVFVSVDCGYRKPHINFLKYVTSKTKLKPNECVMIGDRLSQDIRMANLYDIKSIYAAMVDHEDNNDCENEYYDYYITDFKQLEEIFL
ncbi:MAG: HAD-IA family hydrolase [Spirochaetales bacterium]|nr:HAD-IA family hydrolase [Spirochaetales bacterium]